MVAADLALRKVTCGERKSMHFRTGREFLLASSNERHKSLQRRAEFGRYDPNKTAANVCAML